MMQVVHELGHVTFALASGGQIEKVVLHPLTFSRTDVSINPHPLVEVWGGAVVGTVLPLAVFIAVRLVNTVYLPLFRFFAAFCCIANGAYIGFGPNNQVLDTGIMLSLGCSRWHLLLFGIPILVFGVWLLNDTGKTFGYGVPDGKTNPKHLWASSILFLSIVALELIFSG